MEINVELSQGSMKFDIEFTPEQWEVALESAYKKEGKKYAVPGFRKGKVPRKVIEKNMGADIFWDSAIGDLFVGAYKQILSENEAIEPIAHPSIHPEIKDGILKIKGSVDILPEFTLGKYTGVEIKKTPVLVEDKHVNEYLERMRNIRARQVEAGEGHKLAIGDIAVIDFVGSINGVEFQGGKGTDYELELGSGSFIDTFEKQLVGKKAGESVDVNVSFPKNYHAKELAGAPAKFAVTIKKVMVRELPKLDDDFARSVSEFDTLDLWKADILARISQETAKQAEQQDEDELITKIVDQTKIDVPNQMIENQLTGQLEDLEARLAQQGANLEVYAEYMGQTLEQLRVEQRKTAESVIRTRLVFDAIARAEKLEPTKDEFDAELKKLAHKMNKKESELKKDRQALNFIEQDLQYRKITNFLKTNNKIS